MGWVPLLKLIYTVNICLYAGSDDVGVGTEAVVELVVVLYLHVYLTHIVGALADGLDGELLERHVALDDLLQCADGGIYGTVTCGCCLERLACNLQSEACY